jgi:hypothetical protein
VSVSWLGGLRVRAAVVMGRTWREKAEELERAGPLLVDAAARLHPARFPANLTELHAWVLRRARDRCECRTDCGVVHTDLSASGPFGPQCEVTGAGALVVVALCRDESCDKLEHLRAWCASCRMRWFKRQIAAVRQRRKEDRRRARVEPGLFDE